MGVCTSSAEANNGSDATRRKVALQQDERMLNSCYTEVSSSSAAYEPGRHGFLYDAEQGPWQTAEGTNERKKSAGLVNESCNNDGSLASLRSKLGQWSFRKRSQTAGRVHDFVDVQHFERVCTIGTGTFGRVLLVRQKRFGRRHKHRNADESPRPSSPTAEDDPSTIFALKILSIRHVIKKKQVQHVHNEKRLLIKLSHPFIVQLHRAWLDDRCIFMLFEYLPGGELFSYLRAAGRFALGTSRFYSAEVTLALQHLHNLNIVYRDVKPENILLDAQGHAKLIDFGFAKDLSRSTRTYTLCGTPEYLAPEVIEQKGHDKAVDWWALGVLTYEMIIGKPPFKGENALQVYEQILAGQVAFPRQFSQSARDFITRLLSVDRAQRLGSSKKFSQDAAEEIKRHRWFRYVDWGDVYHRRIQLAIVLRRHVKPKSEFTRPVDTRVSTKCGPPLVTGIAARKSGTQSSRQPRSVSTRKSRTQSTQQTRSGVTGRPERRSTPTYSGENKNEYRRARQQGELLEGAKGCYGVLILLVVLRVTLCFGGALFLFFDWYGVIDVGFRWNRLPAKYNFDSSEYEVYYGQHSDWRHQMHLGYEWMLGGICLLAAVSILVDMAAACAPLGAASLTCYTVLNTFVVCVTACLFAFSASMAVDMKFSYPQALSAGRAEGGQMNRVLHLVIWHISNGNSAYNTSGNASHGVTGIDDVNAERLVKLLNVLQPDLGCCGFMTPAEYYQSYSEKVILEKFGYKTPASDMQMRIDSTWTDVDCDFSPAIVNASGKNVGSGGAGQPCCAVPNSCCRLEYREDRYKGHYSQCVQGAMYKKHCEYTKSPNRVMIHGKVGVTLAKRSDGHPIYLPPYIYQHGCWAAFRHKLFHWVAGTANTMLVYWVLNLFMYMCIFRVVAAIEGNKCLEMAKRNARAVARADTKMGRQ